MKELEKNTVESSELVEQIFHFWFHDHEHIRSPFPSYIHAELKSKATDLFYQWANGLNPKAKDELNDEAIGEKFEEFIFETGKSLVLSEDERITIQYPFLPRLGDPLQKDNKIDSKIIDRAIIKEGDTSYLLIKLEQLETKKQWETKMELPL